MNGQHHNNIAEQFATLRKIKELVESDGYTDVLLPFLQSTMEGAHDQLCNLRLDGNELAIARARYVASREIMAFLPAKQAALERALARHNNQQAKETNNQANSDL